MSDGHYLGGASHDADVAGNAFSASLSSHAQAHQPTVYGKLQQTLRDLEAIDQQLEILRLRVKGLRDEHYEVARRISAYCANNSITFKTSFLDSSSSSSSSSRDGRAALDPENWRNKFAIKDAGEVQRLTQRHAELQAQTVLLKEQIARLDEEYYAKWQTCMKGLVELPTITNLAHPFSSHASRHQSPSVTPGPLPRPLPGHHLPEHPPPPVPAPPAAAAAAAPQSPDWPVLASEIAEHEESGHRLEQEPVAAEGTAEHAAQSSSAAKSGYQDVLMTNEHIIEDEEEEAKQQVEEQEVEAPLIPLSSPPPVLEEAPEIIPTERDQTPVPPAIEDEAHAEVNPDQAREIESQRSPSQRSPSLPAYPGFPGLTDVIPGEVYQIYYDHDLQSQRGWYLGTPLPWNGDSWDDKINLAFSMSNMDLRDGFPECYIPFVTTTAKSIGEGSDSTRTSTPAAESEGDQEEETTITGLADWAPGFEHGGPRVLERSFLFLFFDDRKPRHLMIPKRAGEKMHMTKAGLSRVPIDWVKAQDVRTMDDKVDGPLRGTKTGRSFTKMMELFNQIKTKEQGGSGESADGEKITETHGQEYPDSQPEERMGDVAAGAVAEAQAEDHIQSQGRPQTPMEPVIQARPLPLPLDVISPRKISIPPASPPFNAEEAGIIVPDSPDKEMLDVDMMADSMNAPPKSAGLAKNNIIDTSTIHAIPLPITKARKPRRTNPPPKIVKPDEFNSARFEVVLPDVMDTSEDNADLDTIVASPEQPERNSQEKETAPLHNNYYVGNADQAGGQHVMQNYNYIADHYSSTIPVERLSRRLPPIQSLSPELDQSSQSPNLQQQQRHLPSLRQVFEAQQNQMSTVDLAVAAHHELYNNKKRKSSNSNDSKNSSKIPFGHKEMASYVDRIVDSQRMARQNGEGGEHRHHHQYQHQHGSPVSVQMAPPPTPVLFHHHHHRPITPQYHHHRMNTTSSRSPEGSHAQGPQTLPVAKFGWATR